MSRPIEKNNTRPDESNHRARNWMFTLNNYKKDDLRKLKVYAGEKCKYMVIGKEVGKTGVPHLQGYLQLEKATGGQTIKNQSKVLKMWMGLANSPEKADKYCKKDGDFWTSGKLDLKTPQQKGGSATKQTWRQLHDDIKAGMSFEDVREKYPSMVMQTRNAVMAECLANAPKRDFKTCVHVYFGESGTKKTTRATSEHVNPTYLKPPSSKEWFDGYNGRDDVILDEFRGGIQLGGLLSMMDQFQCRVQVKGGMVNFAPRRLTITSNLHPNDWYNQTTLDKHGLAALWRRFNVVKEFKKNANGSIVEDVSPPNGLTMWNDGCVCEKQKNFTRNGTLILDDSEFVTVVEPEELPSPPLPNPKRRKLNPPGKKKIVRQDPIEVESDSDDVSYAGDWGDVPLSQDFSSDSESDPIDSFSD